LRFHVTLRHQPAVLVMSAAGSAPRVYRHDPWALEAALRRVGAPVTAHMARHGEKPSGPGIILYHTDFSADDEISFEVCIPVRRRLPGVAGVTCKELPAGRAGSLDKAQEETRPVWFDGMWRDTPVYRRERLPLDAAIEGPAILEQLDATTVIEPGDHATSDADGNILITVGK